MPPRTNLARTVAWSEPVAPMGGGLLGAGWLPETLCALAVLPMMGLASDMISLGQAASVLGFAGALGVAVLAVGSRR